MKLKEIKKFMDDGNSLNEELLSSPAEIERFMASSLYTDYINEINMRVFILINLLDDSELEYSGRDYDMFRGGKKALLDLQDIFQSMMANKLNDLEKEIEKADE